MSNSELAERIFFELDGLGRDNPHIQKELHAAVVILRKEIAAANKRADEARAVARHEKLWFSNSTEAIRWVRDEARQFYTDNPQVAAHLFETATIFERELAAANKRADETQSTLDKTPPGFVVAPVESIESIKEDKLFPDSGFHEEYIRGYNDACAKHYEELHDVLAERPK